MTNERFITALALPAEARVDQRVPKKLLLEQGAATAADKRQIQDGIEELLWIAALKPSSIGVPTFRDDAREYVEIAVLAVAFRPSAKIPRLTALIHRAIPYPVVLVSEHAGGATLSLAHKRASQAETAGVVAETVATTAPFFGETPSAEESAFLASLAIAAQPAANLFVLYQSWLDRVAALAAARITGAFTLREDPAQYGVRRTALAEHTRLQQEMVSLRSQAAKEKQLNRRVELNLALKHLEAQLAAATANL